MSKKLNNLFDEQKSDLPQFKVWKGKEKSELNPILGIIDDIGVNSKYNTPYLVLMLEDEEEPITVFLSSSLQQVFKFAKLLDGTSLSKDLIGQYIAFRYEGEEKNKSSGRNFSKYKVIFQDALVSGGFVNLDDKKKD